MGIRESSVVTAIGERKFQDVTCSAATGAGEGLNVSIELVSPISVPLYTDNLIILYSFYPNADVHYTFTRLPIYLE